MRRDTDRAFARWSLRAALLAAAAFAPLQIAAGDQHGLEVERYQPLKVAAMEGRWQTESHAPFVIIGWPDRESRRNLYALQIPDAGSLILKHDVNGVVEGLDRAPPDQWPVIPVVFFAFRIMVGLGLLMLAYSWYGAYKVLRRHEFPRAFLQLAIWMAPAGFIATLCGWWVAEAGRQPWVVYGLLRTADVATELSAAQVLWSLLTFVAVYAVVLTAYLYYLIKVIRKGAMPVAQRPAGGETPPGRPAFGGVEDER